MAYIEKGVKFLNDKRVALFLGLKFLWFPRQGYVLVAQWQTYRLRATVVVPPLN